MALSGTFYGTTANSRIKPKIAWWAVQSAEGNYSDITATLSYSRTNSGYKTGGDWKGAITIGDQTTSGSKKDIAITYQSDTEVLTATARVQHDEYGRLSVTVSAEGQVPGTSLESTSISGVIELDEIPRASAVSGVDAMIGSRSTVVVARKSDSYSHSISYCFGGLTGWIAADGSTADTEQVFTADTVNFLLPEAFYGEIPDAPSGVCTLSCRTYVGDALIGEQSGEFVATADPNVCAPTVTVTAEEMNADALALTGGSSFVRYLSTVRCTVSPAAQKGAALLSVQVGETEVTDGAYILEKAEQETVAFTVTDSRGYTGSYTLQLPMLPYVQLSCNATVHRTDPTGDTAVLTFKGNAWCGSFGTVENTLAAAYTLDGESISLPLEIADDHTYRLEIPLTGLDYRQSYLVVVAVSDAAMTVSQSLTVQKGLPVFDWGESDFQFHVPVDLPALTVGGIPLADYIRNVVEN